MLDLLIGTARSSTARARMRGSIAVVGSRIVARFAAGADCRPRADVIDAGDRLVAAGHRRPARALLRRGHRRVFALAVMGGVTTFIGMIRGAPDEPLAEVVDDHAATAPRTSVTDFSFHVVLYDRDDDRPDRRRSPRTASARSRCFSPTSAAA